MTYIVMAYVVMAPGVPSDRHDLYSYVMADMVMALGVPSDRHDLFVAAPGHPVVALRTELPWRRTALVWLAPHLAKHGLADDGP